MKQEKNTQKVITGKKHLLKLKRACHSSKSMRIFYFVLQKHFTNHEIVLVVPHDNQLHLHQLGHEAGAAAVRGYLNSIVSIRQLNGTVMREKRNRFSHTSGVGCLFFRHSTHCNPSICSNKKQFFSFVTVTFQVCKLNKVKENHNGDTVAELGFQPCS